MHNKVIISGASSGIGKALATYFYQQGYDVGLIARREALLKTLAATLKGKGKVVYAVMDISEDSKVDQQLQSLIKQLGGLDIFIANAGMIDVLPTGKGHLEKHKYVFQVNLIGAIACIESACHFFRQQGHGHIVGVSSIAAYRGIPGSASYSASKAALSNYLQAMRTELLNKKIAVSVVHPGFIDTEFAEGMSKYPFVISAASAAQRIYKGVLQQRKNIVVPRIPWSLVTPVLPLLPDRIVRKLF